MHKKIFGIVKNVYNDTYKNIVLEGEFIQIEKNGQITFDSNGTRITLNKLDVFDNKEQAIKAIKDRNFNYELNSTYYSSHHNRY